jgi:hypothetical protein
MKNGKVQNQAPATGTYGVVASEKQFLLDVGSAEGPYLRLQPLPRNETTSNVKILPTIQKRRENLTDGTNFSCQHIYNQGDAMLSNR